MTNALTSRSRVFEKGMLAVSAGLLVWALYDRFTVSDGRYRSTGFVVVCGTMTLNGTVAFIQNRKARYAVMAVSCAMAISAIFLIYSERA